jgi:hypothetical protein
VGRKLPLRKRTQRLAEENLANARKTAKSARKSAQSRWHDLSGALAGKHPPRRRPWIAVAAAAGVAFGALGAVFARNFAKVQERVRAEEAAEAVAADLAARERDEAVDATTKVSASAPAANGAASSDAAPTATAGRPVAHPRASSDSLDAKARTSNS